MYDFYAIKTTVRGCRIEQERDADADEPFKSHWFQMEN